MTSTSTSWRHAAPSRKQPSANGDTMAALPPASADAIARHAGLSPRLVRQWRSALHVGGAVEHDPAADSWRLPPEHAAWLTRAAAPNDFAPCMQYVGLMGSVEDAVLDAVRTGGGVPYAADARCHPVMAEDSAQTVVAALRPGGIFLVQDVAAESRVEASRDHPPGPFLYAISWAGGRVLPRARSCRHGRLAFGPQARAAWPASGASRPVRHGRSHQSVAT